MNHPPAPQEPTADPVLRLRVLREHVASVYASHTVAICAHFGFALAIVLFAHSLIEPALFVWVVPWFATLAAVDAYALFARRWTPDVPLADTPRWARKYTVIVTLVSMTNVPAVFLLMVVDNPVVTSVATVVIMGSWTRAVQARWPIKAAVFGYGLPMMSGTIVALAWRGGELHWLLATFCTIHLALTLRSGIQQNRRLTESLMLRFENEQLAERLKQQIDATRRASEEKTRFLAAASHDLRQPMHAIALLGAVTEQALDGPAEKKTAEQLMRAVDALGASLDAMLDVSRLDAGVMSVETKPFALDVILLALERTFSPQAAQKGLALRVRTSGLWVCSDAHLLHRMLSNLVDNALKYTRRGGVIVRARAVGDTVRVDVRDTGIGIAPDQLGRIFEEFYQIGQPGRSEVRGMGLGLSIVQRLSQLLRHPVLVESRPDRGTRFRVIVQKAEPVASEDTDLLTETIDPSVHHHAAAARRLSGRILLVEDEAEIRAAMIELLHAHAIDAVAVAGEREALEVLAQAEADSRPFSMLLCDFRLADGEDGLAVGLRLRARLGAAVPLLLITGETAPERLQRARAAAVPTLFKPVSASSLLRGIAELAPADEPAAEGNA